MVSMSTMFVRTVSAVSAIVMAIVATNRLRGIDHASGLTPSNVVCSAKADMVVVVDTLLASIVHINRRRQGASTTANNRDDSRVDDEHQRLDMIERPR